MAVEDPNIAVKVGGDVTSLQGAMNKGSKSVKSFSKNAAKYSRQAVNQFAKVGAAAAVLGAGMVAALYTKQSKVIDQLAKTADALDVTTERLQAMRYQSELSGVSSDEFDKSLRKLETRLGEAARRGGTAAQAFSDMGIDIDKLMMMRPDQQMQAIADGLSKVENQSLKASITMDIFGREGIKMVKVLGALSKEGVDPTVAKLEKMGIAITRIDAAKVEAANDAFFKAQKVTESLANTLTVELAPYIEEVANQFISAAEEGGGFNSQVVDTINTTLRGFAKVADVIQGLKVVFKGLELVAVGFGGAVVSVMEVSGTAVAALIDNVIRNVNMAIAALNKLPKVDIASVDPFSESDFMKGLHRLGDASRNKVGEVRSELHNLAMQEMPSDKVEEFLATVTARANEAAASVAKAVKPPEIPSKEGLNLGDGKDDEDKEAKELQKLQEKNITEQELLAAHMEQMALIGEEWDASKFETEEKWRQTRLQAEQDFYGKLGQLANQGYSGVQSIISAKWGAIGAETSGAIKSIVGTMATGSRKAFEVSKAWAMADALISTYQGIAAGVRLGWPMGIPAVAWATATGFAQISKIKNQKFGGAGGAAASGSGTPATAPNPVGVGGSSQSDGGDGGGALVTFSGIDPNKQYDGRHMISVLNEAIANGAKLRVAS